MLGQALLTETVANGTGIELLDSIKAINIIAHTSGGSGGLIKIGDPNIDGTGTMFQMDDFSSQVFVQTNGDFGVQSTAGFRVIDANLASGLGNYFVKIGDANLVGNGTQIYVDDGGQFVKIGDVNSISNGTRWELDDVNLRTDFYTQDFYLRGYTNEIGIFAEITATYADVSIGDLSSAFGGTAFRVMSSADEIRGTTDGFFNLKNTSNELYFYAAENLIVLGRNSSGNNTNFSIDDTGENMLANLDGVFRYQTTAGVTKLLVDLGNSITAVKESRFQMFRGSSALTAANNLTIGSDGNAFFVNGNTQINLLSNVNWQNGSEVVFIFNGTPTLKHNQVTSGAFMPMLLAGSVDFAVTAGTRIKFLYTDGAWYELSRTIA
jgi:hypothetical protein